MSIIGLSRWLAVFMVVMYHVRFLLFVGYDQVLHKGPLLKLFYFLTGLGHEGFVVYMLLSGVTLGGLSYRRWRRQGQAMWRDLGRKSIWFYSLLVPALVAGGLLDLAGSRGFSGAGVYAHFDQFSQDLTLRAFAANLLMVQRLVVPGLGSNSMLYILSYECWSYLTLAAFFLLGGRTLGVMVASAIAVAGAALKPEFFGYFVLWMIGFLIFQLGKRPQLRLSRPVGLLVFAAALLGSRLGGANLALIPERLVPLVRMLLDLQFGLGLALLMMAGLHRSNEPGRGAWWRSLAWRLNRRFAGANTVIFATHFPFMMFTVACADSLQPGSIGGQPSWRTFVFFALMVGAIYLYAFWFTKLISRIARLRRTLRWTRPIAAG